MALSLIDAYTTFAREHHLEESDVRAALVLTQHHLNHESGSEPPSGDWSNAAALLTEWLTKGHTWVAPDWSSEQDIGSLLLHRCPACTWAVAIAHLRASK